MDKIDVKGNVIKSPFQEVYEEFQRRKSVILDTSILSNVIKPEEKSITIDPPKIETPEPIETPKPVVITPIPIKQESEPLRSPLVKQEKSKLETTKDPLNSSVKSVKIDMKPTIIETSKDMRVQTNMTKHLYIFKILFFTFFLIRLHQP